MTTPATRGGAHAVRRRIVWPRAALALLLFALGLLAERLQRAWDPRLQGFVPHAQWREGRPRSRVQT